jgi:DNA-binding protein HU-beta
LFGFTNKVELMDFATKDLIAHIAEKEHCTKKDVTQAVKIVIDGISELLTNEDCSTLRLQNLGIFSIASIEPHTGRNPKTGEELQIKASKVPSFKPGKGLKDSVA